MFFIEKKTLFVRPITHRQSHNALLCHTATHSSRPTVDNILLIKHHIFSGKNESFIFNANINKKNEEKRCDAVTH